MAYAAGVDVGSTQTKAVIIGEAREIVSRALVETGANVIRAAEKSFEEALRGGELREEEVEYVVGTGYGRYKAAARSTCSQAPARSSTWEGRTPRRYASQPQARSSTSA
jgi:activator of 2-hydroxyglutaryl-CoA dehydratase